MNSTFLKVTCLFFALTIALFGTLVIVGNADAQVINPEPTECPLLDYDGWLPDLPGSFSTTGNSKEIGGITFCEVAAEDFYFRELELVNALKAYEDTFTLLRGQLMLARENAEYTGFITKDEGVVSRVYPGQINPIDRASCVEDIQSFAILDWSQTELAYDGDRVVYTILNSETRCVILPGGSMLLLFIDYDLCRRPQDCWRL